MVTYGFQSKMRGGRMVSGSTGRHPIRESAELGWFIVRNWFKPGRKSMVPYSIQWLMRFKPAWFRHDLLTLLELLKQGKIKPLIATKAAAPRGTPRARDAGRRWSSRQNRADAERVAEVPAREGRDGRPRDEVFDDSRRGSCASSPTGAAKVTCTPRDAGPLHGRDPRADAP